MYQTDEKTLKQINYGLKNRFITVLWYLSDVEGGGKMHSLTHSLTYSLTHSLVLISIGETAFTHPYNTVGSTSDIECTLPLDVKTSIKVVPKKGNAIIFYSLTGDGK